MLSERLQAPDVDGVPADDRLAVFVAARHDDRHLDTLGRLPGGPVEPGGERVGYFRWKAVVILGAVRACPR